MKNIILLLSGLFFFTLTTNLIAQDEEEKDMRPVRSPWNCTMLADNQTVVAPDKGSLEFIIHHRMGDVKNGLTDLFGIYAASNIRLALQYGVTDKIMVGFGTEKDNKLNEFFWKYAILTQTRGGSIPVSLSYFGNFVLDGRDEANFGNDYAFTDRMSYFNQLIVSRKFNKDFSMQATVGYAHINAVDGVKDDEDVYNISDSIYSPYMNNSAAISIAAKYDITSTFTPFVEYDMTLPIKSREDYHAEIKPNLALGFEIATSTHAFQLFVSNYRNIVPQANHLYNMRELNDEGIGVGFNITVRF